MQNQETANNKLLTRMVYNSQQTDLSIKHSAHDVFTLDSRTK
jgi:hypothetical protein